MKELSHNILDIVQNSITARASQVNIEITADTNNDSLSIVITDDGCGIDEKTLISITDPFTTSRTTRKVGMGLPLLKQTCEDTGGNLTITSQLNVGTQLCAKYVLSSLDRLPLGDVDETMVALLISAPNIRFVLGYSINGERFCFDTDELREQIGYDQSYSIQILEVVKEYILNGINEINGGRNKL